MITSKTGFILVHRCRRGAASGRLGQDVIDALAKIDPRWIDRTGVPFRYKPMLDAAAAFHESSGHLRVPKAYVTPAGTGLGWWLSDRRNQRRTGTLHADLGAESSRAEATRGLATTSTLDTPRCPSAISYGNSFWYLKRIS